MTDSDGLDLNAASACRRAAELLADSWQGALPEAPRVWLAAHLAGCADCAALDQTWRELGSLPAAQPSARQRERFQSMLEAAIAGQSAATAPAAARGWWGRFWNRAWFVTPAAVTAALCLAAGLGAGWWLRGAQLRPAPDQSKQIAALQQEVHTTGQLVVLSLLRQQSASERLRGVNWSYRLPAPDPKVTAALVNSLNTDPSPDVRLAALDALQQLAAPNQNSPLAPQIRAQLVDSFQYQKSPLVQIALVDSFVDTNDIEARALMESVRAGAQYDPQVRQRAAWSLTQWN